LFEIYVKERYTIMPREIKWTTDITSSSSGSGGRSGKEAHNLWLYSAEKLDPSNFHNVLYPDVAQRIADTQPDTTGTIAQQPDAPTSRANVPSSSRDTGTVHATVERGRTSDRLASPQAPSRTFDMSSSSQGLVGLLHAKGISPEKYDKSKYGDMEDIQNIWRIDMNNVITGISKKFHVKIHSEFDSLQYGIKSRSGVRDYSAFRNSDDFVGKWLEKVKDVEHGGDELLKQYMQKVILTSKLRRQASEATFSM
jgi:hypothetical protein